MVNKYIIFHYLFFNPVFFEEICVSEAGTVFCFEQKERGNTGTSENAGERVCSEKETGFEKYNRYLFST
jgi:hypothetical protein